MSYLENFHTQIYGPETGRRWVFLHGLMGFSNNWRKIISGLESTERCLTLDQRGHGRSFQPESGYAPEDYATDLQKILDEMNWQKIILVGHSMGGRNALNFASRFPDRVEKLVIEDIGPEANAQQLGYYEYLLNSVPTPFASRPQAKEFFETTFVQTMKTREKVEMLAQYFYANMEEKSDGGVDWRFSKKAILESVREGREKDRWPEVRALSMPTLLIHGANSQELSSEVYQQMLASNKMIKGVEIPAAGHWVHSDQPQAFLAALKDFAGGF